MENKNESRIDSANGRSPGRVLYDRVRLLVSRQPGLFGLAFVAGLWFALQLPGLGENGLWDPWEMDRAHVARQMTGPPRVLVVERRAVGEGLGPIGRWLTMRYEEGLFVAAPEPLASGSSSRASEKKELERAHETLEKDVFHAVVLDLGLVVSDPASHAQVESLVDWLERFRARNEGTELILAPPLPEHGDPQATSFVDYMAELRVTYAEARVEMAARELVGRSWGKPGTFRRELQTELARAASGDDRYLPIGELAPPEEDSYLDRAFWRAAQKRNLAERMTRLVGPETTSELAALSPFGLPEATVVPWPAESELEEILRDFTTGESRAPPMANAAVEGLEYAIDALSGVPALRAQAKDPDGYTRSFPLLDYWLMAASFSQLGFSELASRLPGFVLGLLGLLLAFRVTSRIWGPGAATLVGLVLATCPLFFGQARSVAGEMSMTLALILVAGGLARGVHEGRLLRGPLRWMGAGAVVAFLAAGIYGLLLAAALPVAYVLVARDARRCALVPAAALLAALGVGVVLVYGGDGWSFFSHFGLERSLVSWKLSFADRPVLLNFDRLIRQIGFGAAPWTMLLPFAFGYLALDVLRRTEEEGGRTAARAGLVVLLWLAVPWFLHAILLREATHFVFPAIPALAVAVALLLARLLEGRGLGSLVGLFAAIVIGLLLGNVGKSPEPLTTFLTTDPPLTGPTSGDYPEAFTLPVLLKAALAAMAVLLLLHGFRLASRVRRVVSFLAREKPFWIALFLVVLALVFRFGHALQAQIAQTFTTHTGALLEPVHRLYVRNVLYWRPETLAFLALAVAALLGLVAYHTRFFCMVFAWLRRWLFTAYVFYWTAVLLAVAAAAMALGLHESPSDALWKHSAWLPGAVGILLGIGVVAGSVRRERDNGVLLAALAVPLVLHVLAMAAAALGGTDEGVSGRAAADDALLLLAAPIGASLAGAAIGLFASRAVRSATPVRCAALLGVVPIVLHAPAEPGLLNLLAGVLARAALVGSLAGVLGLTERLRTLPESFPLLSGLREPFAGFAASAFVLAGGLLLLADRLAEPLAHIVDAPSPPPALAWAAFCALGVPLGMAALRDALSRVVVALALVFVLAAVLGGALGLTEALGAPAVVTLFILFGHLGLWRHTVGMLRRAMGFVSGALGLHRLRRGTGASYVLHAGAMVVLGGLSLLVVLSSGHFHDRPGSIAGPYPEGLLSWLTVESPVFLVGAAAAFAWLLLCALAFMGVRAPESSLFRPLNLLGSWPVALLGTAVIVTFVLCGIAAQLYLESGLTNVDFLLVQPPRPPEALADRLRGFAVVGLVVLAPLAGASAVWHHIRSRLWCAYAVTFGAGLAASGLVLYPLARKYLQLESAIQGAEAAPFLPYLLYGSPVTQVLWGLLLLVVLIGIGRAVGPVRDYLRRSWFARLEIRIAMLAVVVAAIAGTVGGLLTDAQLARFLGVLTVLAAAWLGRRWLPDHRRFAPLAVAGFGLLAVGATALLPPAPAVAAVLAAGLACALALWDRRELPAGAGTGALLLRAASQIAVGSLPLAATSVLLALTGSTGLALVTLLSGAVLALVLLAGAGLVIAMRLGLGVADVLERLSGRGVAGALFALLAVAEIVRAAASRGTFSALDQYVVVVAGAGLLVLAVNLLARWIHPLRALELIEHPRVFIVVLAIAAGGFAFLYNQQVVTAFSFHVSQKHIIRTVADAEGGALPEGRTLQVGLGGGRSKRNFYIKDIPEAKDSVAALRALASAAGLVEEEPGNQDEVLALATAASGVPVHRVVRAFDRANDADGDGRRDRAADAGLAAVVSHDERWLEDPEKEWTEDQWRGYLLIDSDGWSYPIVSNTATRIVYDPANAAAPASAVAGRVRRKGPAIDPAGGPRNRYIVDHPESASHLATALAPERLYLLLPKIGDHPPQNSDRGSFSDMNHRFRKLSGGRHLAVLDDRSSRILLATSTLRPGEEDRNWLRPGAGTLTREQFLEKVASGDVRGAVEGKELEGIITWEGSVKLLGWGMDSYSVSKGKKFRVFLYFLSVKPVTTSYKLFVHLDRAGHRIHTDHWPLAVSQGEEGKFCIGCFQTDHWLPGDIIADSHERDVPYGAPSGETEFFMGFFNPQGEKRMKVSGWNDQAVKYGGSDDRVRIGSFVVR